MNNHFSVIYGICNVLMYLIFELVTKKYRNLKQIIFSSSISYKSSEIMVSLEKDDYIVFYSKYSGHK